MATFQLMNKTQVAHLLWAIFVDARAYFNTPHNIMENPPVSSLEWLIGAMKGGSLPSALSTPLNTFFESTDGTGNPYQLENGTLVAGRTKDHATNEAPVHPQAPVCTLGLKQLQLLPDNAIQMWNSGS